MGQHDSDVERRMWVKGKLEEINNSNMKMGREEGEKKKALSNAEVHNEKNISKLSTGVVVILFPLWLCSLHRSQARPQKDKNDQLA